MGLLILLFGSTVYFVFFATFLYLIAFVGDLQILLPTLNRLVPKSVSSAEHGSLLFALSINVGLILLFGLQHSIMARQGFKAWLTRAVPSSLERSIFVLATSLVLICLYYFWQTVPGIIWQLKNPLAVALLWGLFTLGWLLVLYSTFVINHFNLFGLRQVYLAFKGETYQPLAFKIAGPYKFSRHPLYLGLLMALWATPIMTMSHLVLSLGFSAYIFVGVHFEEKDLMRVFGEKYRQYTRQVSMILSCPFKKQDP